jgi:type III secretion system (T3SS) chaperone YscW
MSQQDGSAESGAPSDREGARVTGTIEFRDAKPARDVTVYVRVQDTSRTGGAAVTVAEQIIERVEIAPGSPPLAFSVPGIPQNTRGRYTVRVHADVDGNGVVSRGDYVSTQSYPVDPDAPPRPIAIVVQPVR